MTMAEMLNHSRAHTIDGLTSVPDRKSFDKELQRWIVRRAADQYTFVCAMIDLDHFKAVNDTYGHQAGDFILGQVANFLTRNIRPGDFLARYGGEEFVVLIENADIQQAQENLNTLLSTLRSQEFEYKGNQLSVTFSCGLAECTSEDTCESLIARSDSNLYEAKRSGRNRILPGPLALSAKNATGN
jgi:diguanylate cyclase (GGDEF)-like protein